MEKTKFNNIVIVGGMANTFLKFFGLNIGKSIYEKNLDDTIKNIIDNDERDLEKINSKEFSKKIDLTFLGPSDVIFL